MAEILLNPILLSVVVLLALCLYRFNVLLALIIASIVGGLISGMSVMEVMVVFSDGMGSNSKIALSYVLLGAMAYAIQDSGLAEMLGKSIMKLFGKHGYGLALGIAFISIFSQNLIPIHISFIPILIPPLLGAMNKLKLDRRAVACGLTFGLKAPYIAIPAGFGLIFHGIIANSMVENGMDIAVGDVWKALIIPAFGMLIGLLVAVLITYRKPRDYEDIDISDESAIVSKAFGLKHTGALVGALSAFVIQILTDSLPLGALVALLIMLICGTIEYKNLDNTVSQGIKMMGYISFVMLVAAGYAAVMNETGSVEVLVKATSELTGGNMLLTAIAMLVIGLVVTLGIGSSFSTIPIIAVIFVPIALNVGFSPLATACLIGVAGALGDAGSPSSDSTLGPTAGLNADGQHNHIADTCIPTFLHFNIPLIIFGLIAAMIL